MAAPSPPQNPPSTPSSTPQSNLLPPRTLRPLLYTALLLCPILALLPPRKLDLYTFALGGAWVVSAQEIALGEGRRRRALGGVGVGAVGEQDVRRKKEDEEKEDEGGVKGMLKRLLYRGDGERRKREWVEKRRLEEEREEVEEKGYGGVILGEVREVLGRDRDTGEKRLDGRGEKDDDGGRGAKE